MPSLPCHTKVTKVTHSAELNVRLRERRIRVDGETLREASAILQRWMKYV